MSKRRRTAETASIRSELCINDSYSYSYADGVSGLAPVRDSKVSRDGDGDGTVLLLPARAWAPFVAAVSRGAFPV
ncbi:DUF397 domain-containing protein [Streptomyces sp. AC602_WCS936]|uniref:DUF397 domain-containing protein n=1 Tax=Streptomyces sp. AC602_WCS936 TaxID=2823685 RepID=UPI0020B751A8|nr:DUF397 domain-containing protein [Streptomyces sp. AC602_WCS936]